LDGKDATRTTSPKRYLEEEEKIKWGGGFGGGGVGGFVGVCDGEIDDQDARNARGVKGKRGSRWAHIEDFGAKKEGNSPIQGTKHFLILRCCAIKRREGRLATKRGKGRQLCNRIGTLCSRGEQAENPQKKL